MSTGAHIVLVLDATLDDMPLDRADTDRVHVWLCSLAWSPRRAFLTQGNAFLTANGGDPDNPTSEAVAALRGGHFYAEFDSPPFEPIPGEFVEMSNVKRCPPINEVLDRWEAQCEESDPA